MPLTKIIKGNRGLKFAIPDSDQLPFTKDELLIPVKSNDCVREFVPLNFTTLSSREVGRQHSTWSVRHSHLIFLVGNLRAEVGNLKHDLKNAEAAWIVKHVGDYKNKWEADYALAASKKIRRMRETLKRAEASLIRYEALSQSYEGLRNAASRELSRRASERTSKYDI